ncbi:MAG: biopolymer transporter ExbD, partial [Chlorobium sp.]
MIDFGEHLPEKKHFDLTPMIDIVFQLLIFFLLTSIYAKPMLPVDLPASASAIVKEEPDITVSINRDGLTFLNNRPVSAVQLGFDIKKMLDGRSDRTVCLLADKTVNFGLVIDVMDRT